MSFWHTVFAIVLGNAIYDFLHMLFLSDNEPEDPDALA